MDHLESQRTPKPQKPPLALTVTEMRNGTCQVRLHIRPDLSDDPALCEDVHVAITAFIERSCQGASPVFTDGTILVVTHSEDEAKSLDTVLFSVIRIATLLQVTDGDVSRLPGILRDPAVGACLTKLVAAYIFDGSPGNLVMRPAEGHLSAEESATLAKELADAGHVDLAAIVLTGPLKSGSLAEKVELAPAYLSYLMTADLLSDEEDVKAAFDFIVDLLRETDMGHRSPLLAACYPFVRCLLERNMLEEAFQVMTKMHPTLWNREGHEENYLAVMECIVRAESLTFGLAEKVLEELGRGYQHPRMKDLAQELARWLSATKGSAAAMDSRPREDLRKLGFEFTIDYGGDGHVVLPLGNSVFVPDVHGPLMIEHAEALVQSSQDLEHLRMFCWPLLDFLMNDPPEEVVQRVLELAAQVLVDMAQRALNSPSETESAVPTIQRMQRLIEAAVLQRVLNRLPTLDQQQALNVVAWVHQGRASRFASFSTEKYDALLARMLKISGVSIADLDACQVDMRAAKVVMAQSQPTPNIELLPFFVFTFGGKPDPQALMQCWKTVTHATDVECLTRQLRQRPSFPTPMNVALVPEARDALKRCLAGPAPDIEGALELYTELIEFVDLACMEETVDVEWATQILADMSAQALSSPLCQVHPNAAAWPMCRRVQMLIRGTRSPLPQCLEILSKCAALPNVTVDDRLALMFHSVITSLGLDARDLDEALRVFMIRESIPPAASEKKIWVPVRLLALLVTNAREHLLSGADVGVDLQKAAVALLTEALAKDEDAAMQFLGQFLDQSRALEERGYLLLPVILCKVFIEHYEAKNDIYAMNSMIAKATNYIPADPELGPEARKILEFLDK